jgi:hypothetical protein
MSKDAKKVQKLLDFILKQAEIILREEARQ